VIVLYFSSFRFPGGQPSGRGGAGQGGPAGAGGQGGNQLNEEPEDDLYG